MSSISYANFWATGALSELMGSIPIWGRYDHVTSKGDFLVEACFFVLMENWAIGSQCHIPNSTWIPKVFPSHSQVISIWSLSYSRVLPSTLKYFRVSRVKPELVHLPPYTRIICIPPSLAPSLLRDFGIPALYYSLYPLYTRNWHTSEFLSFQVHIPFRLLCILVPLLTPFRSSDLRFLWGSVTTTQHIHSSGTLPRNLVPLAFPQFSL